MKAVVFTFFGLLIVLGSSASEGDLLGTVESLEEFLETGANAIVQPSNMAVGLGLTVTNGDRSFVYTNGFGFRDVHAQAPATNKSLFAIASITKSFTSLLAVKILNEKFPQLGERVLDIPINDLVPSLNLTLSDRYRTESVSFKDLLAHRTCLSSHVNGINYGAIKDTQDHLYRSRYESEICPFRSSFQYNDVMYSLAGQLIAQISGQSYASLMRNFLDSLGMSESRLLEFDQDYDAVDNLMRSYYIDGEGTLKRATSNLLRVVAVDAPDGALLVTPDDMAKYIYFHLNGGRSVVGDTQIVPKEVMAWTSKANIPISNTEAYGLGLFISYGQGQERVLFHSGGLPPFASLLTMVPSLDIGIFTSTNGPGYATPSDAQEKFHSEIIDFIAQSRGKKKGSKKMAQRPKKHLTSMRTQGTNLKNEAMTMMVGRQESMVAEDTEISNQHENTSGVMRHAICTADEIVGRFGHPTDGDMIISIDNETERTVALEYGTWGVGHLIQIGDEECTFHFEIETDAILYIYSLMDDVEGEVVNNFVFKRSEVTGTWDTVGWEMVKGDEGMVTFRRDFDLASLPEIPYDENSCVAENIYYFMLNNVTNNTSSLICQQSKM